MTTDVALDRLRHLDGASLANVIETFDVRLRNEGFADGSVRRLTPPRPAAIGHAATARIKCASPPPIGHRYHDRTDWWSYIVSIPAPRFVVVQDIDERRGLGAFVGDVHASILRALGCVAYATNGAVRDVEVVGETGFQFFASGVAVSHAFSHIVDFGGPVEIGGLPVVSGDLLFGDGHGLQSVPAALVEAIPAVAADLAAVEAAIVQLCVNRRGFRSTPFAHLSGALDEVG